MGLIEESAVLRQAAARHRPADTKSRLLRDDWSYVEPMTLDDFSTADWAMLDGQRAPYLAGERARQALEMLAVQADAPSFGYQINNYEHCLQSATMALKDGRDEETVVVSLFHDLGFVTNNETHGEFAAALLKPYVSKRNHWMLERHMYFQAIHCASHPAVDPNVRERWRGHADFEYTADWVARFDIVSIDPSYENAPLETFVPMVHRVLSNPAMDLDLPD